MIDGYIGPCNAVIGVKMCKIVQIMWIFLGFDFFYRRFKCPDCDKVFRSELGFQQHRSVHLGSMVQCSVCTEMFVR